MPDSNIPINAPTTPGQDIASFQDALGKEHEKTLLEFIGGGGQPVKVSPADPLPVTDAAAEAALASIAAEDFATQTTLANFLSANHIDLAAINALLTTIAAITQPLTDTQLRASAVPVTISGGGGGAVSIADGADVTEGAIADAIVAAGAAGTLSAKLRRVTQGLEDLKTLISVLPLPTGASTSALQTTGNTSLSTIAAKDFATQTTLAAILAKIIAAPSTEAKQDTGNTSLASILAKIIAAPSTEAKQDTIITALGLLLTVTDFDTKTGSLTETAPATDTASSGLNGRLQRVAQRITSLIALLPAALGAGGGLKIDGSGTALPVSIASGGGGAVTIADGADVAEGATADAVIAAGAAGTLSAKLRAISRDLIANIVLAAGTNLIGKVGIDQTTPGTTNAVVEASAAAILAKLTAAAASFVKLEDVASVDADAGVPMLAVRKATPANTSGSDGDYEFLQMSAGKLWVQAGATQKPSIGATVVLAVTALQSMTSSATVGWKSVRTSNLATLATDYEVFISITTANTAPANDKAVYLFVIPWYTTDAGSTWFASSGGTATLPTSADATYTIASPHNFRLLGVLNYTTAQMVMQDTFLLSNCFGNRLPDGFSFFVENFTGATLSTGNVLDITPINDILV